jgi:hypothetical protein
MLVLSTYQCWAGGTDHGSHQGGVSGFITVMGGSLNFSKNHRLQVFEKSEPKNNHQSASDISKPSKNQWFDERTIGSLPVL